jgi:predicted permease
MLYLEAFSKVLPVLLLFALGALFRRTGFLHATAVEEIKKLIVNVTLPAVLVLAFAAVTLEAGHLAIAALVFAACAGVLVAGRVLHGPAGADSAYLPPLLTGFEAGMMGYAIFAAVYGAEQLFNFAVVDLGQVVFVFFILVPFVQRQGSGAIPFTQTVRGFITTPVILSIVAGILLNRLGVMPALTAFPLTNALFDTLGLLAAVTTPLIGLVIGYEVNVQRRGLSAPVRTVGVRLAIWVVLGLLLNTLVVNRLFLGDRMLQAAVMTMFVLPPPFVIPLFLRNATPEDQQYVVNTLSFATLVTMVAFTIVSVVYPPI